MIDPDKLTVEILERMLTVRRNLEKALAEKARLETELAKLLEPAGGSPIVTRAIQKLERPVNKPGNISIPGKPPRLKDVLQSLLAASKQPLSVTDLTRMVLASGYRTTSADPNNLVSTRLYGDAAFKAVGRGMFVPADSAAGAAGKRIKQSKRSSSKRRKQ